MRRSTKIATAAAVAAIGMGGAAASAEAYTIGPASTSFIGTNTGAHGGGAGAGIGAVEWSCPHAAITGTSGPTADASVTFRPEYDDCTATIAGVPVPASVTAYSDWTLTVTGGTGPFSGSISIWAPGSGHAMVIAVPSFGCEIYLDAQSGLSTVTSPTGSTLTFDLTGVSYTQNGSCPIAASGTDATYGGVTDVPGMVISN